MVILEMRLVCGNSDSLCEEWLFVGRVVVCGNEVIFW